VLKKRGMYEDTVIVFSSDHGEMLGDFGTMGKRSMLEGAAHIPLMIRVPGLEHRRRGDVCSLVDLAPTLLTLAGIGCHGEFDGIDLFGGERREAVYSQYSTGEKGTYMVATDRDKLVWSGPRQRYYYFNTKPEDTDRYDSADPRVWELQTLLAEYMAGDIGTDGENRPSASAAGTSKLPYGPKRADHKMRRADELAQMPAGYPIDL